MALDDLLTHRIKKSVEAIFMAKRPPAFIRHKLDFGYRIENQSLFLFKIRPVWQNESQLMEHAIAKLTYVKKHKSWKLYWMRQDLNWYRYEPAEDLSLLEALLKVVMQDEYGAFFG